MGGVEGKGKQEEHRICESAGHWLSPCMEESEPVAPTVNDSFWSGPGAFSGVQVWE